MGGSDQWGNITTGVELIRRMDGGTAHALTTPLIKKADGTKFGKTESGNIWLDPQRTSPYKFYQFWLNAADEDAAAFIRIFTTKTRVEIEALEAEHAAAPHLRILQRALAEDITTRVHSAPDLQRAQQASDILFGKSSTEAIHNLDESTLLDVFEGVPQFDVPRHAIAAGDLIELLATHTAVFPSKSEARKMIQAGGVALNKAKVENHTTVAESDLLNQRYLLVQKGKKNYYLLRAV
jgi:tyrosyl-tRNA synthetase